MYEWLNNRSSFILTGIALFFTLFTTYYSPKIYEIAQDFYDFFDKNPSFLEGSIGFSILAIAAVIIWGVAVMLKATLGILEKRFLDKE